MSVEVSELTFEDKFVDYLTELGGVRQWQYLPKVKTTEDLWNNFKKIVEQLNQDRLSEPLSVGEFKQIQVIISQLETPYQAGQFLYGMNGISQVEVDLDNGEHVYLKIFDQDNIGAGDTVYQIVNQIERPAVIPGRKNRRFDTTLLINGLPILQIEEKADGHDAKEALNQMHQYIDERQYSDIFSTLQILVAITPHDSRYMANTTSENFNTDFAFRWQRAEDNKPVLDWKEFANNMLSIPMAHQMATSYMILDGTPRHQMIKAMRPYQVYATQRVIQKIRQHTFGIDDQGAGYVWHTTGSGKTISSFKAAWLASRLPNVDKVVFLVDRIALTNQTVDEYTAYDPENAMNSNGGVVTDTANRWALERKLKSKGSGIIVTSTYKLDAMVRSDKFKPIDKNVVFIVDEAHRSTSGDMLKRIKGAFQKSAWIGYTGTPVFDSHPTTQEIFGDLIHAYTIRDAIADGNVLGFKVDFETTLSDKVLREQYLPEYFKQRYPKMSDEDIRIRIEEMNDEDMDDRVEPSVYDNNAKHIELVVDDILKNWNKRSRNGKYNALFTTHACGVKASTPMAMSYYREFKRRNAELDKPLRVGITFSQETSNGDNQLDNNKSLREAMDDYNKEFNTSFDDRQVQEYTDQLVARLNRTIDDGKYFDIVIVVNQLLTGFNAPQLNTLYVDRTMSGSTLIQAYSRTNRVFDMQTKPFGRIVNYRWPRHSEQLMKKALAKYANRESANVQIDIPGLGGTDDGNGVEAPSFDKVKEQLKKVVDELANYSDDFSEIPSGAKRQEVMYNTLRKYNHLSAMIKQYDEYDDNHPEVMLDELGMSVDDEERLTTTLSYDLKEKIALRHNVDISQIDLEMEHIKEVKVDYDYLDSLIADLMNKYHAAEIDRAKEIAADIKNISDKLEDRKYAEQINQLARDILAGDVKHDNYPVLPNYVKDILFKHNDNRMRNDIFDYKKRWGLADIDSSQAINQIISNHVPGSDDLNIDGILDNIIKQGVDVYKTDADAEQVRELSKIKYRTHFRRDFKKFADNIVNKY